MRSAPSFQSALAGALALMLAVAALAGCASDLVPDTPAPTVASVRDRLAAGPTRLFIATTPDAGTLGAEHYTTTGWQSGTAPLSIEDGALVTSVDATGALEIASLELAFASIAVPPSVFGTAVELSGVRLALPAPASAPVAWKGVDAATAAFPVTLQLSWSLAVNESSLPLGVQELPPIQLALEITGTRDRIIATLELSASGELWSWADLLQLTALDVAAEATTIDEPDDYPASVELPPLLPPLLPPPPRSAAIWSLGTPKPTVTDTLGTWRCGTGADAADVAAVAAEYDADDAGCCAAAGSGAAVCC